MTVPPIFPTRKEEADDDRTNSQFVVGLTIWMMLSTQFSNWPVSCNSTKKGLHAACIGKNVSYGNVMKKFIS